MAVKQLIERIELDSSASSITFSSIPQDYAHLQILVSARTDKNGNNKENLRLEFNGSLVTLEFVRLLGSDGSASSGTNTSTVGQTRVFVNATDATANTFSSTNFYISNYTSTADKSISVEAVAENNSSSDFELGLFAINVTNSSAVTSLALLPDANDFISGSTFSLYGVTAGGDGTVTTS